MAKRSKLDTEVGDLIRQKAAVRCPHCDCVTMWTGVYEYANHREKCAVIELGRIVGQVELPPGDDLIPEVPKKPKGWGWGV